MASRIVRHSLILFFSLISSSIAAQSGGGGGSGGAPPVELWCVAKNNAEDSALQSALDWVCGPGGADCRPIQKDGPCYDSSDVQRTASFAFNDYFLKHGLTEDSCNFSTTAALTSLNPSHNNCKFPSSFSILKGDVTAGSVTAAGEATGDLSSGGSIIWRWSWGIAVLPMLFAIVLTF